MDTYKAARSPRMLLLVAALVAMGTTISLIAFDSARDQDQDRWRADFERELQRRVSNAEQHLAQVVERLRSVSAFYLSSQVVDAQEFRDFTAAYLHQHHGLNFIGWAPAEFSESSLDAPFDNNNPTVGASLPLRYIEPGPYGNFNFGQDLAAEETLLRAVAMAFRSGHVHYFLKDQQIVFVTPTLDQVDWSGVIVAALPFSAIEYWLGLDEWPVNIQISEQAKLRSVISRGIIEPDGYFYETSMPVDGEIWAVRAAPSGNFGTPPAAWMSLGAGLSITGLLAFLIITLATSADSARELVRQRTRELETAEQEARSRALQLADKVKHNSQVITSIPSLLVAVSADGVITEWNRAMATLSGIDTATAVGRPFGECGMQGDPGEMLEAFHQCMHQRRTIECEQLVSNSAGNESRVRLTFSPFFDHHEQLKGCLIVGDDVTEKSSMEMQLREAQRLEAVGRLAAGIAHEVNTPAQFVSDNTSFLKEAFADLVTLEQEYSRIFAGASERLNAAEQAAIEQARVDADRDYLLEEVPQALEQSMDGIRRIADIVRAMKEFSHPGGGGYKEQVDLNRLITNAITVASNEWKYHAEIETELDPELPPVLCYPRELNQVVLNLLINGAHAIADRIGDSGERGQIRISTAVVGEHVQMRISDSGTGIPEHVRDKIFEPFFTTKEVGRGSGQGLALAYSAVVEKHNGELSFETRSGVGTTFIVSLPLQPQEAAA